MPNNRYYRRVPQLYDDRTTHVSQPVQLVTSGSFNQRTYPFHLIDIPITPYPGTLTSKEAFRCLQTLFNTTTPRLAEAFGLAPETLRKMLKGHSRISYTMTLAAWALLYEAGVLSPNTPPLRRVPHKQTTPPTESIRTSLISAVLHAQSLNINPAPKLPEVCDWRGDICTSLKEIRRTDLMLTQKQLARVVGMSSTQISAIEQDLAPFSYKLQLALRCILHEIGHPNPNRPHTATPAHPGEGVPSPSPSPDPEDLEEWAKSRLTKGETE